MEHNGTVFQSVPKNGTNGTDNVNVNDNVNDLIEPSQTMFLNSLSATSVAEDSFPF